jgi:adenine-specific DNA-methyltransferase
MTRGKSRLELTWIGKETRPKLEPRILIEDPSQSYHAAARVSDQDQFGNQLIFGDNLLALKALESELSGSVKCIYIDPPYNTGSAFLQYDDGVEHSIWLTLMRDRLTLLKALLSADGTIWIQIDDNEHAYLKVLLDEVFGRKNFIGTVIWQKKYAAKSDSRNFSEAHDFIIVYAHDISKCNINRLQKTDTQNNRYKNRDKDARGPWKAENVLRAEEREYAIYPIVTPSGRSVLPPKGASWRYTKEKMSSLIEDDRIWFGEKGDNRPSEKRFLSEVTTSMPPTTIWLHSEVGHNDEAKREAKALAGALKRCFQHQSLKD